MIAQMRGIDRAYLDQYDPSTVHNAMFFEATGLSEELYDVLADIRVVLSAAAAAPKNYDIPGPIEVQVYEGFPGATKDRSGVHVLKLASVREYFEWIGTHGRAQLDRFNGLRSRAHHCFDRLPDGGDGVFAETQKRFVEELPIRSFKEELGEEMYSRVITQRLSTKKD